MKLFQRGGTDSAAPRRRGKYSDELRAALAADDSGAAFRRGTTLSTFHSEAKEKSERQRERNLRMRRRKLGLLLLIVAGIVALGVLALSQFNGSLDKVASNAPALSAADADRYKKLVDEYFAKNPFERFGFARRNQALAQYAIGQAPEVQTLKIASAGLAGGQLQLTFRRPVAMWISGQTTSYVDSDGVVFARNYFAEPSVKITDDSGAAPVDGVAASARFLTFVGQVTANLAKNGATVERVVIPRGAVRYVDFYLQGRNYPFMAQIDRNASSQAADILAMAKYLDDNNIAPSYVDVRVAGKGFWR